jgi:Nitrile hydratase, alpha chain
MAGAWYSANPKGTNMTDQEEQAKKMGSVVAKCWSDESFKKRLLADPAATLKAEGVKFELPVGMTLKAVENTDNVYHIIIPPKPAELSDEQLDKVAGGFSSAGAGVCQPAPMPTIFPGSYGGLSISPTSTHS